MGRKQEQGHYTTKTARWLLQAYFFYKGWQQFIKEII